MFLRLENFTERRGGGCGDRAFGPVVASTSEIDFRSLKKFSISNYEVYRKAQAPRKKKRGGGGGFSPILPDSGALFGMLKISEKEVVPISIK